MVIHPLRAALALLLAVPLLVLGAGAPAHACSCRLLSATGVRESEVAFAGTVEDTRTSVTRFAVDQVWAGDLAAHTEVGHGSAEESCGLRTHVGEPMVVTASYDEDGDLRTGLCSVLRGRAAVDAIVREVGPGDDPGAGPVEAASEPAVDDGPPLGPIGVAAGLLVLVVVTVVRRGRARAAS